MLYRFPIAAACAVAFTVALPNAANHRFITETDLYKFTWIADPQISPDGSAVAFVRVVVNEKENRYETSLYIVPTSGSESPRALTAGTRDVNPRWSPDGKKIAFIRTPAGQPSGSTSQSTDPSQSSGSGNARQQPSQVFLLQMDGGEARPLTELSGGVTALAWSPDGKTIAFTAMKGRDGQDRRDAQDRPDGRESQEREGAKSDVKVITRAVYRANGVPTYVDNERHSHIFTLRAPDDGADKPVPTQITDSDFDEQDIEWSPDGSKIYFTSVRVPEPYYEENDRELFSVGVSGGPLTKVAAIEGGIGNISVSPDGKRIAFVGVERGRPIRSYSQPDLWVTEATPNSTPRNLTSKYDFDIAGGIGGDQAAPRGQNRKPIVWSSDGRTIAVAAAEHGSSNLKIVDVATGRVSPLTDSAQDVVAYSATPQGNRFAATFSTQTNIGDIFLVGADLGRPAAASERGEHARPLQITHVNDDLFKDVQQSEPEELWYRTFDGKQIQGWILKPPDFDANKKYPLILEIHGGPHSAYGNVYMHEFQWMAAKRYVVLFTNPRGSTSYGQEFGNLIQYRYPGDDYKDLMAGVDEMLKKGYIDANRLGVTGGSGGGLLTNWTITQTQRFKAAVAQRDIADWYGFWFTADFTLFQPTWFRKAPWEDPQDFAARSPITHVANVTTPLMLVLGDQDYRTPPADGGEMMFRALKYRRIPTVMVRFPRETHELSRSGEPRHRVERLQHIVGWMDQWLMGRKNAVYQTQ
jgi:dipeptidyl aminopeptidase/acylaminoacyl peptidase